MTEKRYVKENFFDEYAIKKEDTILAIVDSGTNARKICNELNNLHEENEQLKILMRKSVVERLLDGFEKSYKYLEDENEQLRKQNQELIQGIQETAKISANGITKPMVEKRWGKGVDYD